MGSDSTLAERLDEVFGAALRERRVVGAVAIVARDGQVKYRRAHGLADREGSVPMREDTLFRLASVTKPIVAMAVLRLVGDELIRLDDPVTRWLPDFRPSLADGTTPDLTIHHLLTHTAGLSYGLLEEPESPFHALGISDGIDVVDFDLRENLRRLAAAPLVPAGRCLAVLLGTRRAGCGGGERDRSDPGPGRREAGRLPARHA